MASPISTSRYDSSPVTMVVKRGASSPMGAGRGEFADGNVGKGYDEKGGSYALRGRDFSLSLEGCSNFSFTDAVLMMGMVLPLADSAAAALVPLTKGSIGVEE